MFCFFLNDCDKTENIDRGDFFPDFECPVDSIFEETKESFLGRMEIQNQFITIISDLYLLLVSIIVNF